MKHVSSRNLFLWVAGVLLATATHGQTLSRQPAGPLPKAEAPNPNTLIVTPPGDPYAPGITFTASRKSAPATIL